MITKTLVIGLCVCMPMCAWANKDAASIKRDEIDARKAVRVSLNDGGSAKFGKFSTCGKNGTCLTVNA